MVDSIDPYASIAKFYDLEHDDFFEDVEMYLQFATATGGPVLELACGSGRIVAPLANAGYVVAGADSSAAMLERARRRSVKTPSNLSLIHANMQKADSVPGGPFNLAILALGALGHLPGSEVQVQTLAATARSLAPGGLLVIDMMHASPGRLYALTESLGFDGDWSLESGETVERFSAHTVHPADQVIESRIWYDVTATNGVLSRHATSLTQRYITPGELALMLQIAGFQSATLYGNYELGPFEDDSDRLIAAATTPRT